MSLSDTGILLIEVVENCFVEKGVSKSLLGRNWEESLGRWKERGWRAACFIAVDGRTNMAVLKN